MPVRGLRRQAGEQPASRGAFTAHNTTSLRGRYRRH